MFSNPIAVTYSANMLLIQKRISTSIDLCS